MYTKFEDFGSHKKAEKSVTKHLIREKEKRQIKGMISIRTTNLSYMIKQLISNVLQNFKILGAVVSEKSLPKTCIRGKEKWMKKGNDMHADADSVLHDTRVVLNVCTKFQNHRCSSS